MYNNNDNNNTTTFAAAATRLRRGGCFPMHRDTVTEVTGRVLTAILYLSEEWRAENGVGPLRDACAQQASWTQLTNLPLV